MILYWLIAAAFWLVSKTLFFLPEVTELPLGTDYIIGEIVGRFHALLVFLPPLQPVWLSFKIIIVTEIGLMLFALARWILTFRKG